MVQPSKSSLAWSHQFPPPFPEGVSSDDSVTIRYDGVRSQGESVIFAVIGKDDLARLPSEVLDDLPFGMRGKDGEIRGNPDAFFVGTEVRLSLYVNTEAFPDFIDTVREGAERSGLLVLNAHGDLHAMRAPDGDIVAPEIPAFIENGMSYVPSPLALSFVDSLRISERDHDGPSPGLC